MNKALNGLFKTLSVSRSVSIRNLRNQEKKDPGIRKRAAILQENPSVEDELDDLEADFFDLGKSHKQYQQDVDASRELAKYHIVRQKYFKEKFPNFLTWADKQQIRHLYNTDPEEWSIERLSEGFPALPGTIQKIVRNNWVPKNPDRVKRHDAVVQENWHVFKTKRQALKLLPEMIAHLNKFTSRELNLNPDITELQVEDVSKRELVKKGGEFSNIIQSYEALKSAKPENNPLEQKLLKESTNLNKTTKNKDKELIITDGVNPSPQDYEHYPDVKLKKKDSLKVLTFDELQSKLVHKTSNKPVIADDASKEIVLQPEELNLNIAKLKQFKAGSHVNLYKPTRDYKNLMYPERIRIPADKRRKGYTYKLNDCFYDSDGEFLYRVPGMC